MNMGKILEDLVLRFLAEFLGKNLVEAIRYLSAMKSYIDSGDQTIDHAIEELEAWIKLHL
jgi:hypothetical protein